MIKEVLCAMYTPGERTRYARQHVQNVVVAKYTPAGGGALATHTAAGICCGGGCVHVSYVSHVIVYKHPTQHERTSMNT